MNIRVYIAEIIRCMIVGAVIGSAIAVICLAIKIACN